MGGGDYLLFEASSGYALFEALEFEEIGSGTEAMQQTVADISKFSRLVKLKVMGQPSNTHSFDTPPLPARSAPI